MKLLSSILISLIFISAGFNKIKNFNSTVQGFQKKLGFLPKFPNIFYKFVIFLVIVLEILAPLIIIYFTYHKKYNMYVHYSIISIILFTILATLLYHMSWDHKNFVLYNLSIIGGLLLLLN